MAYNLVEQFHRGGEMATKRHILQVEVGEELEREIEDVAQERHVSKSDAARDLLRRGLRDFRREQNILRSLQAADPEPACTAS